MCGINTWQTKHTLDFLSGCHSLHAKVTNIDMHLVHKYKSMQLAILLLNPCFCQFQNEKKNEKKKENKLKTPQQGFF